MVRRRFRVVLVLGLLLLVGAGGYLTLRYRQMSRFAGPWHATAASRFDPLPPAVNEYVLDLETFGSCWYGFATDYQVTSGMGANVGSGRWTSHGDTINCHGVEYKVEQRQGELVLTRRQVLNNKEVELVYHRGWGPLERHWPKELARVGRGGGS